MSPDTCHVTLTTTRDMVKMTSDHGKQQGGILPKVFGTEIAVRWEERMRCVSVVVVMDDVVGGG